MLAAAHELEWTLFLQMSKIIDMGLGECCRHVELSAALGKAAQHVNIVAQPPI